ncbi:MAG: PorT family protein [Prevotella sp.]|nr:PorT family protein [Prevotella sp.]
MKKLMMVAAMMIAAVSANAQNEVGQITLKPTVGLNIATMTKGEDTKVRPGFIAGVEAEYGVSENFGVTAGIFYSQQGVKGKNTAFGELDFDEDANLIGGWVFEGDATMKLDYINIPIMAQYYPIKGLALKAGIQPGFNVSKKVKLDGTLSQGGVQGGNTRNINDSYKIKEGVKGFQFAIPVGLSYEYKSFVLDARYNIYLTKALKESDSRHSVFSFTLGYKFAL